MTKLINDRLYDLLPAIYRTRDKEQGEALKALLDLIYDEMKLLQKDIDGLYEDWFIETCSDWVIPYIGDLLGCHGAHALTDDAGVSRRGYVANTIAYRRRKGTASVLEQVSRDVTGWPAHAVEFFQLLALTQNLNHLRLDRARTACIRDADEIELVNGPFESTAHTPDIRRIETRGGRYNIPNVGIFLWRLQSYPLSQVSAHKISDAGNRYTFDPIGLEIPLFNRPQTEDEIVHLSGEINVPGPLRRYPLFNELEAHRKGKAPMPSYFDPLPVFGIDIHFAGEPDYKIPPEDIFICNMPDWRNPPATDETETNVPGEKAGRIRAAIDPVRGKLTLLSDSPFEEVLVSYSYGFSGDVGAGPYDRTSSIQQNLRQEVDWQMAVSKETNDNSIQKALDIWRDLEHGGASGIKVGLIAIADSQTYEEEKLKVTVPAGCQLMIVAASLPNPMAKGQFVAKELRPLLRGDIEVVVPEGSSDSGSDPGELIIDGLLIDGKVIASSGSLKLQISHTTFVPSTGGIKGEEKSSVDLTINRSICGPISIAGTASSLILRESIVDSAEITGNAINAEKVNAQIDRCTILGKSHMRRLEASNSIFTGDVTAAQRQDGCVRYSSLPIKSRSPRRFRCQPNLALGEEKEARGRDLSIQEVNSLQARLRPVFTSVHYGDPGYAQLSRTCAEEIKIGAEDGSEMGVFGILEQPHREANLRAALDEYLRFGLEAGIFYIT